MFVADKFQVRQESLMHERVEQARLRTTSDSGILKAYSVSGTRKVRYLTWQRNDRRVHICFVCARRPKE